MAKPDQVLIIDPPNELTFSGPFTVAVSSVMKLRNPSSRKVCFKIKTTAPKRYCVKPNSGVIDPDQTVQISVSLQPFEYDPNEKNRHKFMVQSMFAPDGDINTETMWKESDTNQLMDSKLKCVFVMPEQENLAPDEINTIQRSESTMSRSAIPPSPKNVVENDVNLKKTVEEIKKLQEEVSALRHENIQLKEESLRQKRFNANRASRDDDSSSSSGARYSSTVVTASNPNVTALNTAYLYAAVAVLILGMLIGKWVL